MPLSMTGYGNAEFSENGITLRVDIKSLNSRFLDIQLKLHRSLYEYESKINSLVKQYLERGRVTVSMDIETNSDLMEEINIDKSRLKQYLGLISEISTVTKDIKQPDIEFFLNNQEIVKKETKLNTGCQVPERTISDRGRSLGDGANSKQTHAQKSQIKKM